MKIFRRRAYVLLLMLLCIFALPGKANADTKVSMKKTRVKWDLKPGKTYRVKSKYHAIGMQNMDVKVTNFKKTKRNGKVTVTFTVTFDLTVFRPTKSQVHRMIASMNNDDDDTVGGHYNCYIIDYATGRNLDYEEYDEDWDWDPEYDYIMNDMDEYYEDVDEDIDALRDDNTGVYVSVKELKEYGKITTYDNDGCYVWLTKQPYRYTITYPASYKNLCIGVGGCSYLYTNVTEEKFNCGVTAFANTRDYKARPGNWHFMRVR